jgi:hypothetical protein
MAIRTITCHWKAVDHHEDRRRGYKIFIQLDLNVPLTRNTTQPDGSPTLSQRPKYRADCLLLNDQSIKVLSIPRLL